METVLAANQNLFWLIFSLSGKNHLLDYLMIFTANDLIFIILVACLYFSLRSSKLKGAAFLSLISIIIGFLILYLVGLFIYEPRPFYNFHFSALIPWPWAPTQNAFPSRHTLILSATTFSFFYFQFKYRWWLVVSLVLMGFARVYVGVHYPIDIVGAVAIGFISVVVGNYLLQTSHIGRQFVSNVKT